MSGLGFVELRRESHDTPALRGRKAFSMPGAQVVGMRLGVGGQGAQDCDRIGIDVRQRGHRGVRAACARASTLQSHEARVSPVAEPPQ